MKPKTQIFLITRKKIFDIVCLLGDLLKMNNNYLSILCFHSISNNTNRYGIPLTKFEQEVKRIAQKSEFVDLGKAIDVINGAELERPSVILTVDDGYRDAMEILPIAKKYNIPIAIFILSDGKKANRKELDNRSKLLSIKEIKHLKKQGWTIGCHSATHADFNSLTTAQLRREIINSKKIIEKKIGANVDYFSYPKGICNEKIIQVVKEARYKAAFGVWPNTVKRTSNKWNIPRIVIDKTYTLPEFPAVYSPSVLLLRRVINPFWNLFS